MVDYRIKLGINFDLSQKQIEILQRDKDTLVRAVPGSGKTTILTLKIKKLLLDNPGISRICCISYTNVNVEDLEKSCSKMIGGNLIGKIEFLTFHRFCLQYILEPFSYLYRNSKGLRPYKKIFNYKEHGSALIEFLKSKNTPQNDINKITDSESIYYNFKLTNSTWRPISDALQLNTVIDYLVFLKINKLIDFNLINLLSLFIVKENAIVKRTLNKSIDWIFIDEFQDVSEIQCKIIEELKMNVRDAENELKWFMVGDPNQSIYGFAGANPRSMFDMRNIFNKINEDDIGCEIKLDKTHRCSDKVFNFARECYNLVITKVRDSSAIKKLNNDDIIEYLEDLQISHEVVGNGDTGNVFVKSTLTEVDEIVNLKITELPNDEVCCIGINKYNSIAVYRQYRSQNIPDGDNFAIYAELYRDYEDKFGFKYFSLFICYLTVKSDFYNNRIRFSKSINKFIYSLRQFITEKVEETEISDDILSNILLESTNFHIILDPKTDIFDEFLQFTIKLVESFNSNINLNEKQKNIFRKPSKEDKIAGIDEQTLQGFIDFITNTKKEKLAFEIKHIHKIKGLEYDQVILQKVEDLPHKANYNFNQAVFFGKSYQPAINEIYNYIQELNKLYVMLTRAKKNLYIVLNKDKKPIFLEITYKAAIAQK